MAYLSEPLHHAYLLAGKREVLHAKLIEVLKDELGISAQGNPDFSDQSFETFSIEDARTLMLSQGRRAVTGRRVYILSFFFATLEAQNALLKTLEEPTPDTSFFIIVPAASVLLPTVRSRLARFDLGVEASIQKEAEAFLAASVAVRLKVIEKIGKSDNESKKSDLLSLLIGIEEVCAARFDGQIPVEWAEPLRELLELKKYAFDRAPSVKMLGEYLSLRLPKLE
ncbi:hypothetical protein K8Q93_02785 [Candidatus Parcubacteria bacterium]|nr:hypothetical protein [Candidatus Parcubacteria bacterium]